MNHSTIALLAESLPGVLAAQVLTMGVFDAFGRWRQGAHLVVDLRRGRGAWALGGRVAWCLEDAGEARWMVAWSDFQTCLWHEEVGTLASLQTLLRTT